ncbi:MAG TPA: hypothetical protein VGF55_12665 [Gemmataceae bacterium]|jgi:hypothetical protein
MLRAASILSLPAALALAATAPAAELPVIINGSQLAQAPKTEPAPQPAPAKGNLPVIINYPSAAMQAVPANDKLPKIVNLSPAAPPAKPAPGKVVFYNWAALADVMGPVGYNAYSVGPSLGLGAGLGYELGYEMYGAPYAGGLTGYYAGYGGAYPLGYAGYGYAPGGIAMAPSLVDLRPPRVEVLDTGVRANVGHLTSMPAVREPVYGQVIAVYPR